MVPHIHKDDRKKEGRKPKSNIDIENNVKNSKASCTQKLLLILNQNVLALVEVLDAAPVAFDIELTGILPQVVGKGEEDGLATDFLDQ